MPAARDFGVRSLGRSAITLEYLHVAVFPKFTVVLGGSHAFYLFDSGIELFYTTIHVDGSFQPV